MRRRPLTVACAVLLAVAAHLSLASKGAAGDVKVVLIGASEADATVARVRQELVLLGVDVDVLAPDTGADLAALARDRGAAAVARVETAPPEIVLWVDGAHSGGAAQETRVSESLSGRTDPGLLALRAVELLRGRLLPVPAAPATATSSSAAVPPAASASAAPRAATPSTSASALPLAPPEGSARPGTSPVPLRASRGSAHLGPALAISPGGVPVAASLRVGGALRVAKRVDVGGLAVIPLSAGTVSAAEGEMDLRVLAIGAGAGVHFTAPEAPFSLRAGAGVGAAGFFYEGRASAPWISASGNRWAALPFLEVGGGYRFTSLLAVRADVLAAIARPEPVLVIAGRSVASFGTPVIFTSLALEVHP